MPNVVRAWTRLGTYHDVDLDRAFPIPRAYVLDVLQSHDMSSGWGENHPALKPIWDDTGERAVFENSLVPFLPVRPRLSWPPDRTPYIQRLWVCEGELNVFEWTFNSI